MRALNQQELSVISGGQEVSQTETIIIDNRPTGAEIFWHNLSYFLIDVTLNTLITLMLDDSDYYYYDDDYYYY